MRRQKIQAFQFQLFQLFFSVFDFVQIAHARQTSSKLGLYSLKRDFQFFENYPNISCNVPQTSIYKEFFKREIFTQHLPKISCTSPVNYSQQCNPIGDLWEMYRRPLTNISRALRPLFIGVSKGLREMLPYFAKILFVFCDH